MGLHCSTLYPYHVLNLLCTHVGAGRWWSDEPSFRLLTTELLTSCHAGGTPNLDPAAFFRTDPFWL
jgi:hypothetical protein